MASQPRVSLFKGKKGFRKVRALETYVHVYIHRDIDVRQMLVSHVLTEESQLPFFVQRAGM